MTITTVNRITDAHDWTATRIFLRIGEAGATRDILDHFEGSNAE